MFDLPGTRLACAGARAQAFVTAKRWSFTTSCIYDDAGGYVYLWLRCGCTDIFPSLTALHLSRPGWARPLICPDAMFRQDSVLYKHRQSVPYYTGDWAPFPSCAALHYAWGSSRRHLCGELISLLHVCLMQACKKESAVNEFPFFFTLCKVTVNGFLMVFFFNRKGDNGSRGISIHFGDFELWSCWAEPLKAECSFGSEGGETDMARKSVYLSGQSSTELWVLERSLSTVRAGRSPNSMCASYLISGGPELPLYSFTLLVTSCSYLQFFQ